MAGPDRLQLVQRPGGVCDSCFYTEPYSLLIMSTFRALLATRENGTFAARIEQISQDRLPPGEVLVRVRYSSLNYKDGLAVTGKPGVIRSFPMVPGIDFAGTVEESTSAEFRPGDAVALTGAGAGETAWGGYSQYARWNADSLVR